MHEQQVARAMETIRARLRRAPRDADTVDTIHASWIAWGEPAPATFATLDALQRLREDGEVECVESADGRLVWRSTRA